MYFSKVKKTDNASFHFFDLDINFKKSKFVADEKKNCKT